MGRSRFHSDLLLKLFMKRSLKEKRAQKFRVLPRIILGHRGKKYLSWLAEPMIPVLHGSGLVVRTTCLRPWVSLHRSCYLLKTHSLKGASSGYSVPSWPGHVAPRVGLQIHINSVSFRIPNLQVRSITQVTVGKSIRNMHTLRKIK